MTDDAAALFGNGIEVVAREPVAGGVSDASTFRVQVILTGGGQPVERTLLLKQTSATEVAALTAAARVPDVTAIPELIYAGENSDGPYILTEFYAASPAKSESALPGNVIETLARIHAHYLRIQVPRGVPVVDPDWWRTKCDVSMKRLHALERPVAEELCAQVKEFREAHAILEALEQLPRTLIHGDVHRNNVLVGANGQGHIIDWGGSFIGSPALDLPNIGGADSTGFRTYLRTWRDLTGHDPVADPDWQRARLTATVWANIKYLAFATKMFGDAKGQQMISAATAALALIS
ncbi:hypothetical protein GCM10011575_45290 [Microlunatus endophyticus]|uniref:Aminoglycoside phosphotransferase domain-containing protein n=1 Tax=Microlunatus endophyticus TaxID=1716077 RepID=A0A917SI67_9ACTN|nr:aminoglycoside phosphotransferase family protein [Microlunatus endophyticus]GGL81952.1 hypothetical protein GCM10011575_45290 [Microlunatus endophyticus]